MATDIFMQRHTREIQIGGLKIGGANPIVVQSMTKTDTRDVKSTILQIKALEQEGCELIRVAVPDEDAALAIKDIVKAISIPLVADIHFDPRLALLSMEMGAHGIRINPGNIGGKEGLSKVIKKAKEMGVAIRIGVNSGSVHRELLKKYGGPTPEAMVESAIFFVGLLEGMGFCNMKISLKSSSVKDTIMAYELISKRVDYPLHVGITESGTLIPGTVKSSIGIGALLMKGIGDTIRVSLCSDPIQEIRVAYEILRALELRKRGPEVIACPTCGRCEIDLKTLATQVEEATRKVLKPIKIAVMGCVVNGPGEAREADIGIAGGRGKGILFKKGVVVKKVREEDLFKEFILELDTMLKD